MFLIKVILVTIIIVILCVLLLGTSERFSNTENMQIYNTFKNFMNTNGTFNDLKNMLENKKINFSEGTELFDRKMSHSITFDQYMTMLKKYNKNQLNVDSIDQIRQSLT